MILKEHQSNEQGLADLLNYAHIIADGIIINKDGAFLTTYTFTGPDISTASTKELDALTAAFNRMATLLDDGWMLHIDELRVPCKKYASPGHFPCQVAALIDEERRQMYLTEGAFYENVQYLTFVWKFPLNVVNTTRHWFVDGISENNSEQSLTTLLKKFQDLVLRCINLLNMGLVLKQLSTEDLLSYLNICITGKLVSIAVPIAGSFIDVILGRHNLIGGYVPKVGDNYIYVLSIVDYLNIETVQGLLEELGNHSLQYRWSNRFIALSEATAEREIKRYQRNWNNKVKGFMGIMQEAIFGRTAAKVNVDAVQMSNETTEALTLNSNHSVRFGYWTSSLILHTPKQEAALEFVNVFTRYLEQRGFACIKEDVNAFDAWLGSVPGHGSCNVRRIFLNSINLAHILPLHTAWTGADFSDKASLLPTKSPPVFYATTAGKTPFRLHLDVADVGHQIVLGPTGAGKSTYLGLLIAQFLRYSNAQIYIFDKDYSHQALTAALDGFYYDIGNAEQLAFCPLADLSSEAKQVRAGQFIENLVALQQINITPEIRTAIHQAILSLAHSEYETSRNLTVFRSEVQNEQVRAALKYYTVDGQIKLLDATHDGLQMGHLQTFEMHWLLAQKPEIFLPILLYIFAQIEARLEEVKGKYPTLIVLEEAWLYVSHEIFARQLRDWLKTLRKKNARVVFATQSLTDLYDPSTKSLTSVTAALLESCPTKIYLPNSNMDNEVYELYKKMGLHDRQIEIIHRNSIPKKHYYVVTPDGKRLIDLDLSISTALAFIGLSKEKSAHLLACKLHYGKDWLEQWLLLCKR